MTDYKNLRATAEAAKKPLPGLPPGKSQLAAAAILDVLDDTPDTPSRRAAQLDRLVELISQA